MTKYGNHVGNVSEKARKNRAKSMFNYLIDLSAFDIKFEIFDVSSLVVLKI